jgi:hypothetical protein
VFLELSVYQTLSCTAPSFALPNIGPVKWVLLLGYAGRHENCKGALRMRGPILRGVGCRRGLTLESGGSLWETRNRD